MNNFDISFPKINLSNINWVFLNTLNFNQLCDVTGFPPEDAHGEDDANILREILGEIEDCYLDKMESDLIDSQDLVFRGTYERANM
jgi:hypothetical protein